MSWWDNEPRKGEFEKKIHLVLMGLFLMNILDGITTYVFMHQDGIEGNPLVAYVMQEMGIFWGVFITRFFYAFWLLYYWKKLCEGGTWTYIFTWLTLIFYMSVIAINIWGIVTYLGWL